MKKLISFMLLILIAGCGRPEIKNPEDIISTNAKAIVFVPKIEKIFDLLPAHLQTYSEVLKAAVDDSKPAALVITSLDPLEAYFALPTKEGLEEQLKKPIEDNIYIEDSEIWSGYLFVAVRGSIPSSFGNKEFLPENEDAVIYAKAQIDKLIENNEEKLESYKKYKTLRIFRSFTSSDFNKIFSHFITHDLVEFFRQSEELTVSLDEKCFDFKCKLTAGTEYAKQWNSMRDLKLPQYPGVKEADIEFSSSIDLGKSTFPLKGIETGFKSFFASINRTGITFSMDTVFEKLRQSGNVQAVGALSANSGSIGGEIIVKAENGKVFHESISRFCKSTSTLFFTGWSEAESGLIDEAEFRSISLFGRNFDSEVRIKASENQISLYYPELKRNTIRLKESGEKGILKAFWKTKNFFSFDIGIERVDMKLSVEENLINFKADFKK